MPTLNARDIIILKQPPERVLLFKDIRIKDSIFRVWEDGLLWSISESRWRFPDVDKDGYEVVSLANHVQKLHRLMLTVFDRPPTYGEQCRHLDGDPSNNHLNNLRWGSAKENWADRKLHGRLGTESRRLLTTDEARTIYNDLRPIAEIAKSYNIQRMSVILIKEKQTYLEIHNG
jgi:hypothetical protein